MSALALIPRRETDGATPIPAGPLRLVVVRSGGAVVLGVASGDVLVEEVRRATAQQIQTYIEREWPIGTVVEWKLTPPRRREESFLRKLGRTLAAFIIDGGGR